MTNNHQKLCSELFPLYEIWKSAVLDAKKAMKDFASAENEERIEQARENFQNAKQKAEQAKQEYDNKAYERMEFEEIEIIYKDASLLSSLKEKIGDFYWNQENGRASRINVSGKYFSSSGKIYFPDNLQVLNLNSVIIQKPENLKFPNSIQGLWISDATIQNPENLKLPDNLQWLFLEGTTMNEAFREKLREYKKRNPNVGFHGVDL
jgi:vacuolar-type H+-ATPase subunit H